MVSCTQHRLYFLLFLVFLLRMLTQMIIIIILLYHKLCSFYNCDLMCYVIHVILEKIDTQSLQGFIQYIKQHLLMAISHIAC